MIKHHRDHANSITELEAQMAKLPLKIKQALEAGKWIKFSSTSSVEAYKREHATAYIQPSKTHPDRYAIVIDFTNGKPSITGGMTGDTLVMNLTNVGG
jgi:hypothetical protein